MNYIKLLPVLIIISLTAIQSIAQKDIRKADKQLELRAYDLAIKNYKSYLDQNPENNYAQLKLAEAYRRTNQLMKAVYWYEKSVDLAEIDLADVLNYASSLKKLGLYEKSQKLYSQVSAIDETTANVHLAGCEAAIELLKAEDQFDILPFDGNSVNSDFGAVVFNNKIIFSSFRTDLKRTEGKKNLSYIKSYGNDLFIAPMKENIDISELNFLRSDIEEISGLGPVSYSESRNKVAYTKHNLSDGAISIEGVDSDLSIYVAQVTENGDFTNDLPLPYNEVEYSYGFPHLAFDGTAMYFSSNREGGFGGFDIYVSYLKGGEWQTPENLGPQVNSTANEITPFYSNDILYFSSDQFEGLGGFDIFSSSVNDGKWSLPTNMGKGINSPGDDYYLTTFEENEFIFTSNRLGGRGKDDIYFGSKIITLADEILAISTPEVTDLEDLANSRIENIDQNDNFSQSVSEVSETEESLLASKVSGSSSGLFNIDGEFKLYDHSDLDLEGAIKSRTEPITKKYFIQIASLRESKGQIEDFTKIKTLGNLYRFVTDRSTKIRLGSFENRGEADQILAQVKRNGFGDAFITTATLDDTNIELLNGDAFVDYYSDEESNTGPQYKVRLASYSDATWFDSEELNYLDGDLEQWTKGYWHIFILSGFNSIEEADAARIKAVNRGFKDAEVVIDDRGVLKRLNQH